MKTIKALKGTKEIELGEIRRVDDKTAHNLVGTMWEYISKSEWKKSKGTKETDEVKKKSNTKQMDGVSSDEPFVKTRKKSKKND